MANVTDPSIAAVSGTDPQNLLPYLSRQKIYDSRYWKEECFGLSVVDVLQKASDLTCIGGQPTRFLSLTLKLLQLHPEIELIVETFIEQDTYKYVRALGCLFVRLLGRPVEVYTALEPCYRDARKLRVWNTNSMDWSIMYLDDFIHQLLTQPIVLGIALPRLPTRKALEDERYLTEARPTALNDVLADYEDGSEGNRGIAALAYLKHKALVEKSPAAIELWSKRQAVSPDGDPARDEQMTAKGPQDAAKPEEPLDDDGKRERKKKKKKDKKTRGYDNLFKKSTRSSQAPPASTSAVPAPQDDEVVHDDDYWNEQRSKLGLKPLK